VLFHPPALLKGQSSWLLEKASGKAHFSDVVHKAAKVRQLLSLLRKAKASGDISCVDRDRCRVTSGVLIAGIEGCNQRGRKGQVRTLQALISYSQLIGCLALFPVEIMKPMSGKRRNKKQEQTPA
jgi:hypothetical protein